MPTVHGGRAQVPGQCFPSACERQCGLCPPASLRVQGNAPARIPGLCSGPWGVVSEANVFVCTEAFRETASVHV